MIHASVDAFLAAARPALAKGPVAMVLVEDLVEVDSTLRHLIAAGFRTILAFAPPELTPPRIWMRCT